MRVILNNVEHGFGSVTLFSGFNECLQAGQLIGLAGPSGTGKSTLLALISGSLTPRSGQIRWERITTKTWVLQNPVGISYRSIIDQVAYPLTMSGMPREEALEHAQTYLSRVGLADSEQRFSELSGGEAARFMLARALAFRPDLLLIDEPTAQLDRTNAQQISRLIGELRSEERIVVVASHDPTVLSQCDRVIHLGNTAQGRPREVASGKLSAPAKLAEPSAKATDPGVVPGAGGITEASDRNGTDVVKPGRITAAALSYEVGANLGALPWHSLAYFVCLILGISAIVVPTMSLRIDDALKATQFRHSRADTWIISETTRGVNPQVCESLVMLPGIEAAGASRQVGTVAASHIPGSKAEVYALTPAARDVWLSHPSYRDRCVTSEQSPVSSTVEAGGGGAALVHLTSSVAQNWGRKPGQTLAVTQVDSAESPTTVTVGQTVNYPENAVVKDYLSAIFTTEPILTTQTYTACHLRMWPYQEQTMSLAKSMLAAQNDTLDRLKVSQVTTEYGVSYVPVTNSLRTAVLTQLGVALLSALLAAGWLRWQRVPVGLRLHYGRDNRAALGWMTTVEASALYVSAAVVVLAVAVMLIAARSPQAPWPLGSAVIHPLVVGYLGTVAITVSHAHWLREEKLYYFVKQA